MSIVNRICMLVFSVGLGLGQGFQPVAAFNYGAGKYSRVKKGFWFTAGSGRSCLEALRLSAFSYPPASSGCSGMTRR
ncbi:MAG: MATE family efflux transporter [Blautia sp.]